MGWWRRRWRTWRRSSCMLVLRQWAAGNVCSVSRTFRKGGSVNASRPYSKQVAQSSQQQPTVGSDLPKFRRRRRPVGGKGQHLGANSWQVESSPTMHWNSSGHAGVRAAAGRAAATMSARARAKRYIFFGVDTSSFTCAGRGWLHRRGRMHPGNEGAAAAARRRRRARPGGARRERLKTSPCPGGG